MARLAHLWDMSRCVACMACVIACNAANFPEYMRRGNPNPQWSWLASNIRVWWISVGGRLRVLLTQCMQCDNAPCVKACPTKASYYDPKTGLVTIDYRLCIGCKACVVACPYGARWMDPESHMPNKCLGPECERRIENGLKPVCVTVCPANARDFGDLDDPESSISRRVKESITIRLREELGTKPRNVVVLRGG
jgi:Fe-S-cluster-containing dehydrogenase component